MINNLFRGKRCKDQEWVYGYLVESHRSWRGHKPHKSWIVDSPITNGGWFALMGKSAVIDDTVGAYTGLKDENGTMVFTGDVINDKNGINYIVRYNKEKACFAAYNGQIEVALFKVWDDHCVVIGNIYDESDKAEDLQIEKKGENLWRVSGTAELEEIAEALEIDLPETDEFDTLGGLIYSQMTNIPQDGSHPVVDVWGLHIVVEEIQERRVEWAMVSKLPPEDTEEEEE